jgi:hypothetical protein
MENFNKNDRSNPCKLKWVESLTQNEKEREKETFAPLLDCCYQPAELKLMEIFFFFLSIPLQKFFRPFCVLLSG